MCLSAVYYDHLIDVFIIRNKLLQSQAPDTRADIDR